MTSPLIVCREDHPQGDSDDVSEFRQDTSLGRHPRRS
jgi:hypothetical protein